MILLGGAIYEATLLEADFGGSSNCARYLASLALSRPRWYSVAARTQRAGEREVQREGFDVQ